MAAGVPGVGIAAIFFVLAALWAVGAEVALTLRGRSSLARWRVVGRQAGIAAGVVAAAVLTSVGLDRLAGDRGPGTAVGGVVPLTLLVTSGVLVLVLGGAALHRVADRGRGAAAALLELEERAPPTALGVRGRPSRRTGPSPQGEPGRP